MIGHNQTLIDRFVSFVVDKRKLLLFTFALLVVFSLFSMQWVNVENDITYYLAEDSNTRVGMTIMNEQFANQGLAEIMIANITYPRARSIADEIEKVKGVALVRLENNQDHYRDSSALIVVQFDEDETSPLSLAAMTEINLLVEPYDSAVSTEVGNDIASRLMKEMFLVGALAAVVIILVLIFTSNSYGEIPILLVTFGVAALLGMGSNFLISKISFISNSVGVVLQLALAIDYAIILIHRFMEESELHSVTDAAKLALKKGIKEISSSSLTTIAGLAALSFMQFGIGKDLAFVMIKAILLSMLAVFLLMPGLLVTFSSIIFKTKHKKFISSVRGLGRFSVKTRYIIPPIFLVLLVAAYIFSSNCPFIFSMADIQAFSKSESRIAQERISANFGENNMLALIVPGGDYKSEKKMLAQLAALEHATQVVGLANTQALGDYMLTDYLTPRQFAELTDLDLEVAQILYAAYAINEVDYAKIISGINLYGVPLIDMYQFLYQEVVQGFVPLDDEQMAELESYYEQLTLARRQMEGPDYSRMLIYYDLKVESAETFAFIDAVYQEAGRYYSSDDVYLLGESTSAIDLASTFDKDNLIISILTVAFVILIITFAFRSVGLPVLLIAVIQASIWINFSFPYLRGQGIYFLGYLIVSSIQMGANIDYAIVITSRYQDLKATMPPKQAVVEALSQGFPTVITSGTILAVAGILIGFISTDGATSVLGSYLGQGTIISVILVIFVLPQLLYLGDTIIEKTSFSFKTAEKARPEKQKLYVDGHIKGYVKGELDAKVRGQLYGEISPQAEPDEKED